LTGGSGTPTVFTVLPTLTVTLSWPPMVPWVSTGIGQVDGQRSTGTVMPKTGTKTSVWMGLSHQCQEKTA
jgi:hypothetical protein